MKYLSKLFLTLSQTTPWIARVVSHTSVAKMQGVQPERFLLLFHLLMKLIVYLLRASVAYVLYFKFAARHDCHDCQAASSPASLPPILARSLIISERQQVMHPNCLVC